MTSVYYYDQNPSGFCFLVQMRAFVIQTQGGLAARSEIKFTWSPQLRNLAEWDWVPIFHQNKYGEECGHWKMMKFGRFYVLRHPNIKKRFSGTFLMKFLDIRRRDVWTVHEWLRSSWFGTLASSVIYKLREFSSDQPQGSLLHLLYIFSPTVVLRTLCLILNICYELIIVWVLQQSYGNVH